MEKMTTQKIDGSFKVRYDQGDIGEKICIVLVCINVPLRSEVSFNCPDPGPIPLIDLPPTTVTSNQFLAGEFSQIPAGFTGIITVKYTLPFIPPADWTMELRAYINIPPGHPQYSKGIPLDKLPLALANTVPVAHDSRFIMRSLQTVGAD
jgi:hypothetical protein